MSSPPAVVTLCDMIEHARGALLADQVGGGVQPTTPLGLLQQAAQGDALHLWGDAELTAYANEAVDEVATRTLCLTDRGTVVGITQFAMAALGSPEVAIDTRILQVTRVTVNGQAIDPVSLRDLDWASRTWGDRTGQPRGFVMDDSGRSLRLVPAQSEACTLRLEVVRRPLTLMANSTDEPEIPLHMRRGAVQWMCHLAYLKNDSETSFPGGASGFSALFDQQFGPRRDAFSLLRGLQASMRGRARLHFF